MTSRPTGPPFLCAPGLLAMGPFRAVRKGNNPAIPQRGEKRWKSTGRASRERHGVRGSSERRRGCSGWARSGGSVVQRYRARLHGWTGDRRLCTLPHPVWRRWGSSPTLSGGFLVATTRHGGKTQQCPYHGEPQAGFPNWENL